jgi:hypothetical protein
MAWKRRFALPLDRDEKTTIPSRSQFAVLRQICNLIPSHLVPKLARETGVDKKARTFSPWSHLVSQKKIGLQAFSLRLKA